MEERNLKIIQLKEFLKNPQNCKGDIFIGKTRESFLLGPIVNDEFSFGSFYKRIKSSMLYNKNRYKDINLKEIEKILEYHLDEIEDNVMMEFFKDGRVTRHILKKIPGTIN